MRISKMVTKAQQVTILEEHIKENNKDYIFIDDERIKELQECFLYMLRDFNKFCEEYSIQYMLIGGALLGKIRHGGFIPWDDDFDIAMSREDVEILKKVFADSEFSKKYDLRGPGCKEGAEVRITKIYKKDSSYVSTFSKKDAMNKIFIDIFIIDYVPANPIAKYLRGFLTYLLIGVIGCVEYRINVPKEAKITNTIKRKILYAVRTILGTIFMVIPLQKWYNCLDKVPYYKTKTKKCTIATGRLFYFGEIIDTDVFFPFQKTDFCGVNSWLPNKPKEYLEHRYGDYMIIPDVSEREKHYVEELDIGAIE